MTSRGGAAATLLAASLLGCGGSELTVRVVQESGGGEPQGVADHVVWFYPYDRDSLFAELAAAAPEPEPSVPEDLRREFEEIGALQETWREADAEWAEVRDSLQSLSDRLNGMDRRSREYLQLYQRFTALEGRERELNRRKSQAFDAFDERQKAALARSDSVRAVVQAWEDAAFQEYPEREAELLERIGREVHEDTTGAEGHVTRSLSGSPWFVHTRLSTPNGELYWNVQVDPASMDTLQLSRENAEERLRL